MHAPLCPTWTPCLVNIASSAAVQIRQCEATGGVDGMGDVGGANEGGMSVVVDVPCAGLFACLVGLFRARHGGSSDSSGSSGRGSGSGSGSGSGRGSGGGSGGEGTGRDEKWPAGYHAAADAEDGGTCAGRRAPPKTAWARPPSAGCTAGPAAVTLMLAHGPRRARVFAWAPSPVARGAAKGGGEEEGEGALDGCLSACLRALRV